MGSYYIPSNKLKGEGRILYIFTTKSLIFTAVGAFIGLMFYVIFGMIGLKPVGIGIMVGLALTGYGIGTIKFPTAGNKKIDKNVGGDTIDQVIMNYIKFKKNRKVYSYAVKREEPDYTTMANPLDMLNIKSSSTKESSNNTKEEK